MSSQVPASPSKSTKKYAPRKSGKKNEEKKRDEERRRAEEAASEAREREFMATAENDSRLYALDLVRRARNAARRHTETQDLHVLEHGRETKLEEFHARLAKDMEWNAYLSVAEGSALVTPRGSTISTPRQRVVPIDAMHEAEVNTWLSLWADREGTLQETLQDAQSCELIIRDMDRIAATAERTGDAELCARLRRNIVELREMEMQKIDRATAYIVQHADEHANAKNEVLLAYDTGDIKFCMWINLSKNPRVKTIEFSDLSISIDIPKSLALASVAVRLMHFRFDNLSVGHHSEYASLGGVLHLDLLALPPPPKKVKGWTLRQVTPLATNIARIPYPGQPPISSSPGTTPSHLPPPTTAHPLAHSLSSLSASQASTPTRATPGPMPPTPTQLTSTAFAPIHVTWAVPRDVIVGVTTPQAGWWDEANACWRLDSISTVEFNPDSRIVSLFTTTPAPISLLYNVAQLYPLASWELRPSPESSSALLSVITHTGIEVQFLIVEGLCTLVRPDNKELLHLHTPMDPGLLLKKLALSGLVLNNRAALPPGMVASKDTTIEKETCKQIARMVSAFSFRNSPANQNCGSHACLIQVGIPKEESAEYQERLVNWSTCHITPVGCHLLASEPDVPEHITVDEEVVSHTHLVHCLAPLRTDLRPIISNTEVALAECTESLFLLLGLLSYTS